jgi:hypothetical protein
MAAASPGGVGRGVVSSEAWRPITDDLGKITLYAAAGFLLAGAACAGRAADDCPAAAAGMTSGMTKRVLPGRGVLWELWGVLSVLVVPWGRGGGILVMRRSWVRFPQAAPTFPQAKSHIYASDLGQQGTLWHEFVMPETACHGDTPDSLGVHTVTTRRFEIGIRRRRR